MAYDPYTSAIQDLSQQTYRSLSDLARETSLYYAQQDAANRAYLPTSEYERQYEQLLVDRAPILEAAALRGFGPTQSSFGSRISSKMFGDTKRRAINEYSLNRQREAVRRAQSQASQSASRAVGSAAQREEILRRSREAQQALEAEQRRRNEEAQRFAYYNQYTPQMRAEFDRTRALGGLQQQSQLAYQPYASVLGQQGISMYNPRG
jgi:hypothetical protein